MGSQTSPSRFTTALRLGRHARYSPRSRAPPPTPPPPAAPGPPPPPPPPSAGWRGRPVARWRRAHPDGGKLEVDLREAHGPARTLRLVGLGARGQLERERLAGCLRGGQDLERLGERVVLAVE